MEDILIKIYDLLSQLDVTANYIGFFQTAYAVLLCVQQPVRLLLVTKWLYPEVAKRYGTNWKAVERNIRTVSGVIWRKNRLRLEQLARRPLARKPAAAQLVAILSSSLLTSESCSGAGLSRGTAALEPINPPPLFDRDCVRDAFPVPEDIYSTGASRRFSSDCGQPIGQG